MGDDQNGPIQLSFSASLKADFQGSRGSVAFAPALVRAEVPSQDENPEDLSRINREPLAKVEAMDSPQRVVLDMDSTEIPVYGLQKRSAYNGHFKSTCDRPLLLFNEEGDCPGTKLRPSNVHRAEDWTSGAPTRNKSLLSELSPTKKSEIFGLRFSYVSP